MKSESIEINFLIADDISELNDYQENLVLKAIEATKKAYAPYSNFPVGAAILTTEGEIFLGNNQENVSFPAGTCAERTVLHYFKANYPEKVIKSIAITASNSTSISPISPCGICRQVLTETEREQSAIIEVMLHKINGETLIFSSAQLLLPFAFEESLKKI
jgi:cytidine deaminase